MTKSIKEKSEQLSYFLPYQSTEYESYRTARALLSCGAPAGLAGIVGVAFQLINQYETQKIQPIEKAAEAYNPSIIEELPTSHPLSHIVAQAIKKQQPVIQFKSGKYIIPTLPNDGKIDATQFKAEVQTVSRDLIKGSHDMSNTAHAFSIGAGILTVAFIAAHYCGKKAINQMYEQHIGSQLKESGRITTPPQVIHKVIE